MSESQLRELAHQLNMQIGELLIQSIQMNGMHAAVGSTILGLTDALAKTIATVADEEERAETLRRVHMTLNQATDHFAGIMADLDRVEQIMKGPHS